MTNTPSVDQVMQAANRAVQERMTYIEEAAKTRVTLKAIQDETKAELDALQERIAARVKEAEREHEKAYNAARQQGWTVRELRDMGLPEPASKRRTRRRTPRATATKSAPKPRQTDEHTDGHQGQVEQSHE